MRQLGPYEVKEREKGGSRITRPSGWRDDAFHLIPARLWVALMACSRLLMECSKRRERVADGRHGPRHRMGSLKKSASKICVWWDSYETELAS